ncbi:hypothetical protein GCM10010313_17320 [Streptomyces violarus]|uniref:Putative NAD-dependent epimerase/dehydratase family protein n=1 Tax=Streptomyces violarus TaxID=67380 RepID=A0A7W5F0B1_9ACTN|nr:putative NAD-dependent epimerase/dehydratase family protein [Streptomyces violarus]GHD02965.1 hypothetical protein GCM10010313_17320 [Streptomyces violarus]
MNDSAHIYPRPGPAGLTPVFEYGPRTRGRTVALTFDADMIAGQGARAAGERFDHPRLVSKQVLDGVRPGSVVVLHCTRSAAPATERAVRTMVPELRRRGFGFVKVSELIGAVGGRR